MGRFQQAELSLNAATDQPSIASVFQAIQCMHDQLDAMSRAEGNAVRSLQQEVARLQAEHVRLVNANTLERERIHASESRAQFSTWSELAIERQQQERLREQLREERDKIAYLEKMHCELSAESFKLGGQRTELGAVRQQVEKLTQDRRRYL